MIALREEAGISRARLAALAGLSPTTLYKIEHGLSRPQRSTAIVLALTLGVEPDALLGDARARAVERADAAERDLHARAIRRALDDPDGTDAP